jgi:hypothetical protein
VKSTQGSGQCLVVEFALEEQVGAGYFDRKRKPANFLIGTGPAASGLCFMRHPFRDRGRRLTGCEKPEKRPPRDNRQEHNTWNKDKIIDARSVLHPGFICWHGFLPESGSAAWIFLLRPLSSPA